MYKCCRISLLPYDKHEKEKVEGARGEKELENNQVQDENQY